MGLSAEELFEPIPTSYSGKVRCRECGADGYPTGGYSRGWQTAHLRGHAPCPDCGTPLTLKKDGTPRKHHYQHCLAAQLKEKA